MRRILPMLLVLACGDSPAPAVNPKLSPEMAGDWSGPASVRFSGLSPFSYAARLSVDVRGEVAVVSRICPDGSKVVLAAGDGVEATWEGSLLCPPISSADCVAVTMTYESATIALENGKLKVLGLGHGDGCGVRRAGELTFTGTK